MTKKQDLTLLYRIARQYYIDRIPQTQIAEKENISRSQISRLITRAEQMGHREVQRPAARAAGA